MSQFDRENNEVFALVNEHHRLSRVCQTVGVFVPLDEAEQIAVSRARAARGGVNVEAFVLTLFFLIAVSVVGVFALA